MMGILYCENWTLPIRLQSLATQSMIELTRTQDEEVGDGTTSVIVLAGEMLDVVEAFIDKSYHPTVICQGATMLGLVKSCIGTKFTSQFGNSIAARSCY